MEQNVTEYLIYLLPLVLVLFVYLRRHRKKEQHHVTQMKESVAAGLTEPASLHPVFDPNRCIGSGACVSACPEQAIGLIKGKGHLVKPTVCIGHGACMAACPHDAITLVFGTAKRGLDIAKDETVIAVVARLASVKGVEYFIRAAAELRKKNLDKKLSYLVVGAGSLGVKLASLADELGVEKIFFAGFQKDVFKYLAASDIYVQPSLNEAMGRTVLEAQYMKLPVVASNVCGLPDAVKDGVTGLLVPPGDAPALAAALETLIKDSGLRSSLGEAAGRRILEKDLTGNTRFSVESMNIQLENFYNRILGKYL